MQNTDVILESFSPGFLDSIGFGYQTLATVNPRLVDVFHHWIWPKRPKCHLGLHRYRGLCDERASVYCGRSYPPSMQTSGDTGILFRQFVRRAWAVAALYRRERTGRGDHVDISMQEALATQESIIRMYANEGQMLRRDGSRHSYVAPAEMFPCKDGYVFLYVSRRDWKEFLEIWPDHPAELDGPEWMDNGFRRAHAERFTEKVAEFTARFNKHELTKFLQSRGNQLLAGKPPARIHCQRTYQASVNFSLRFERPRRRNNRLFG